MSWYESSTACGYSPGDYLRFEVLADLSFKSILDVGSGPCQLLKWLLLKNKKTKYEAVDVRTDALEHCNCKTYTKLPARKRYDLVVLFGVAAYCTPETNAAVKKEFKSFLTVSARHARHKVVFTVLKAEYQAPDLVTYSIEEVVDLAQLISTNYVIHKSIEPTEYIVVADIK
jgi:hypothetical protein